MLTDGVFEEPDDHRRKTQKRARRMQSSEAGQFTPREPTTKGRKGSGNPLAFSRVIDATTFRLLLLLSLLLLGTALFLFFKFGSHKK